MQTKATITVSKANEIRKGNREQCNSSYDFFDDGVRAQTDRWAQDERDLLICTAKHCPRRGTVQLRNYDRTKSSNTAGSVCTFCCARSFRIVVPDTTDTTNQPMSEPTFQAVLPTAHITINEPIDVEFTVRELASELLNRYHYITSRTRESDDEVEFSIQEANDFANLMHGAARMLVSLDDIVEQIILKANNQTTTK